MMGKKEKASNAVTPDQVIVPAKPRGGVQPGKHAPLSRKI